MRVLILPGLNNSGPKHWQTRWEKAHPSFERISGQDWGHPVCRDWVKSLEQAVRRCGPKTLLVAHSLACLQVAHWAVKTRQRIYGALLVAPPDPSRPAFPKTAKGFYRVPQKKFRFPSFLVGSSNDSYADEKFSQKCARAWGSLYIAVGPKGHLNAESKLGNWPEGFRLLRLLIIKGNSLC